MSKLWNNFTTWLTHTKLWIWWNPQNLTQTTPSFYWDYMKVYAVIVCIFFVGAIVSIFWPKFKPVRDRLALYFWTNAVLSLILFFFRYQDIPVLGMDIFRLIQEITAVIWLFLIIRFAIKAYPAHQLSLKVEERRNKYLPKAKAS